MPKMLRQQKLAADRRVYVSWREKSDQKIKWKDKLFDRLALDAGEAKGFAKPAQTGDQVAGTLKAEWLSSMKRAAAKHKTRGATPVTDFVGVCTTEYLTDNLENKEGELKVFLALLAADEFDAMSVRVWLAPLEKSQWAYKIADVDLQDPDQKHRWLIRVRDSRVDKGRFELPTGNNDADVDDEIYEFVVRMTDRTDPVKPNTEPKPGDLIRQG